MPKLRAHNISVSLDGYMAGPDQSLEHPLGVRGEELHEWIFRDAAWDVDRRFVTRGDEGIGAWIMGRNMFGPVRGGWGDGAWRGWWGEDPPFHCDVFVLTNHAHDPIEMAGGTTFHFVTDGIHAAFERAVASAGGHDVRLGGGASTIQQYLHAGLVDELHLAVVPILLHSGERLFEHLAGADLHLRCTELTPGHDVTHAVLTRAGASDPGP